MGIVSEGDGSAYLCRYGKKSVGRVVPFEEQTLKVDFKGSVVLLSNSAKPCHLATVGVLITAEVNYIGMRHVAENSAFDCVNNVVNILAKQFGIVIDKRKLNMTEPIKAFGVYIIDVKLYTEISGKINISVSDK